MKVWITRTRPGADRTAARLKALGIDSLIDPVLEVRPLDVAIGLGGVDALAFTSTNGVDVFSRSGAARDLPAFAVGEATAHALRGIGFAQVEAAEGTLASLARFIAARRAGRVLALGPTEPAGDLAAMASGALVEVRAIYETTPRRPRAALAALAAGDLTAVMIHSAKGARAFAAAGGEVVAGLDVLALSSACAEPLRSLALKSIAVAPFPDDASLVRLTAQTLSDAR